MHFRQTPVTQNVFSDHVRTYVYSGLNQRTVYYTTTTTSTPYRTETEYLTPPYYIGEIINVARFETAFGFNASNQVNEAGYSVTGVSSTTREIKPGGEASAGDPRMEKMPQPEGKPYLIWQDLNTAGRDWLSSDWFPYEAYHDIPANGIIGLQKFASGVWKGYRPESMWTTFNGPLAVNYGAAVTAGSTGQANLAFARPILARCEISGTVFNGRPIGPPPAIESANRTKLGSAATKYAEEFYGYQGLPGFMLAGESAGGSLYPVIANPEGLCKAEVYNVSSPTGDTSDSAFVYPVHPNGNMYDGSGALPDLNFNLHFPEPEYSGSASLNLRNQDLLRYRRAGELYLSASNMWDDPVNTKKLGNVNTYRGWVLKDTGTIGSTSVTLIERTS
ncbi:MAG: hypothetical protein ACYSUX_13935 [Planctomycetota bacterium]